jgi:hypothetical protein
MTADAQAQIAREDIDPKNRPGYSPAVQNTRPYPAVGAVGIVI